MRRQKAFTAWCVGLVVWGGPWFARAQPAPTAATSPTAGAAAAALSAKQLAAVRAAEDLFGLTKVWTFHLRIEPEAWETMEPATLRLPGRPPEGEARPGGPPDPAPPPGGPDQPRLRPGGGPPFMGIDFPQAPATLEFEGKTYTPIGVRFKGNSSFRAAGPSLKRSLKLDFNQYQKGLKFFGLTKLNLNNNAMDPSQMREALGHAVFRQAGLPAPRTAFVRLLLTIPGRYEGHYVGLYTMVEQVDERFLRVHFGTKKGLLLKPELPPGLAYFGPDWAAYERRYEPKSDVDAAAAERLITLTRLVNEFDETAFREQIDSLIDTEQCLRFFAVQAALANLDSPLFTGHNFYLYLPPDSGRFCFIPWDLNETFGGFIVAGTPEQQMNLSISRPYAPGHRLLERLLAIPALRASFRQQFVSLLATAFNRERLLADLKAIHAAIQPAALEDQLVPRAQFEENLTAESLSAARPTSAPSAGGGPPRPARPGFPGMGAPKPPLKAFIVGRIASIGSQLEGKAEGYVPRGRGFGPPGGPEAGPGFLLAPAVMRAADTNSDGTISAAEFKSAWTVWFDKWDVDQSGRLDERKLVEGLRPLLPPPLGFEGPPPGEPPAAFDGPERDRPLRPRDPPPDERGEPPFAANGQRPDRTGEGPRPLGPVVVFARQIARAADADRSEGVSREEWLKAVGAWFAAWDKDKNGSLEPREVGEGLNELIGPPRRTGGPRGAPGPFERRPPEPFR